MKPYNKSPGLLHSFYYAFRGIKKAVISERNMRFHIVTMIFLIIFSPFYDFTKAEYCLLFMTIGMVISSELMNTAIETVIDMISPSYSKGAETAKDIAAGAVCVTAVFAAVIGVILYLDIAVLKSIITFFLRYPAFILALIILLILGVVFIFRGIGSGKDKKIGS